MDVDLTGVDILVAAFDAGTRGGNPGDSAIGVYCFVPDDPMGAHVRHAELVGTCTNNVAEWLGLIKALEICVEYGVDLRKLDVVSDSKLVVQQALGHWKARGHLRPYRKRAYELCQQLVDRGCAVTIAHVPRKQNKDADALVTELLDAHMGRRRGY